MVRSSSALLLCLLVLSACEASRPEDIIEPPKAIPHGRPPYPPQALREGRTGTVSLDCTVTAEGATQACVVLEASTPDFAASALGFVQQGRYVPARRDGVAVAVPHHRINLAYTLPNYRKALSATCDVQATGTVRNCRPDAPFAPWPIIQSVLEHIVATPLSGNGAAIDDPNRHLDIRVSITPLPRAAAIAPLPGDVSASVLVSRKHTPEAANPHALTCRDTAPDRTLSAGETAYQVMLGIDGITPLATGEFAP